MPLVRRGYPVLMMWTYVVTGVFSSVFGYTVGLSVGLFAYPQLFRKVRGADPPARADRPRMRSVKPAPPASPWRGTDDIRDTTPQRYGDISRHRGYAR